MNQYLAILLTTVITFASCGLTNAQYSGTQAYNHPQAMHASVNIATGTFHFSYPLVNMTGVHGPFIINLTYRFNAQGMFGLPTGWRLDLDHINNNVVEMGGQWLIDPLWHDETLYASGLKYFNQHGSRFQDNVEEQPIPGEESRFYRYRSTHKDGTCKYFSHGGLLTLQKDRFGNRITFEYQEPVKYIEEARLTAITDNYGNRYTLSYEPGGMRVHYPDGREQQVFFSLTGVSTIINPLQQRYEFKYTHFNGHNLIRTIRSPTGLITELSYNTIPFQNHRGKGVLPVVAAYKQIDSADDKTHHETQYDYISGSNYTGYPLYTMSDVTDSLMDSNDQNYHYSVAVKQIDSTTSQVHEKIYRYNYLHLPVDIRILKTHKEFLKTEFTYAISPFKYSRSTNYDKPASMVHSLWSEQHGQHIPNHRVDRGYDRFGNKTTESHWSYHRPGQYWRQLTGLSAKYYTGHFSLLAEKIHTDHTSGQAIKTEYQLSPTNKNHRTRLTYASEGDNLSLWHPWKKERLCHDDLGRITLRQLQWAAKGRPGIQQTVTRHRYLLDKTSALLTTQHISHLGNITERLMDTRNAQVLAHISALGEKTVYRYNDLGQLTEHIDPEGNTHRIEHYTFDQDGINAKVIKTPLGFKKRHIMDASNRTTAVEDWIDDHFHKISEHEYDAFGQVLRSKNRFGQPVTYQYDDLLRLTKHTDPWLNKTEIVYNDEALATDVLLNGNKQQRLQKTPWSLTTTATHYPAPGATMMAVQITTTKNGFGKPISKEEALLDLQSTAKHPRSKKTYAYDPQFNKTRIETRSFDGLTLTKDIVYDLFNNPYHHVKKQNDNGKITTHRGYQHIYNADNQLERTISPPLESGKSLITHHRYNPNGREIQRQLPDGKTINYQYNPSGLLQSAHWQRHNKTFRVDHHYDADGHLTQISDTDGQQQHYQYDLRGNLTRRIYPDNRQQTYAYDQVGRLTEQKNVGNRVLTYHYDDKDRGKLSAITSDAHEVRFTYGTDDNGHQGRLVGIERNMAGSEKTRETFHYDPYGRVKCAQVTGAATQPLVTRAYQYSPRGELNQQTTTTQTKDNRRETHTISYDYDGLFRLVKETHRPHGDSTIRYQYDGNNNLITEHRSDTTIHRHYNAADQLIRINKVNRNAPDEQLHIRHDDNGRMVVDHLGQQYDYDDKGVLLAVRDANGQPLASFHYLPDGILGHIHNGNKRQSFYYHNNGQVQTVIKNGKLHDYIRYSNKFLGALTEGGTEQLFISNQSTGARLNVDKKGKKSANFYDYEGYGEGYEQGSSAMGADDSSSSDFLWNQEFRDKATGLVYLRHRFYHPDLRRFTTRDTKSLDNRYAYAVANPIAFIDPSGQSVARTVQLSTAIALIAAGAIGAFVSLITAGATLSLSAAGVIAGSAISVLSGLTLTISQATLDHGNKAVGNGLRYTGIALSALAFFALVAPQVYLGFFANTAAQATSDSVAGAMPLLSSNSEVITESAANTSSPAAQAAEIEMSQTSLQSSLTYREPPPYQYPQLRLQPEDHSHLLNMFRSVSQGAQESGSGEAPPSATYSHFNNYTLNPPPYQQGQVLTPPNFTVATTLTGERLSTPNVIPEPLFSRVMNWFSGQRSTEVIHPSVLTQEDAAEHQVETYL